MAKGIKFFIVVRVPASQTHNSSVMLLTKLQQPRHITDTTV